MNTGTGQTFWVQLEGMVPRQFSHLLVSERSGGRLSFEADPIALISGQSLGIGS